MVDKPRKLDWDLIVWLRAHLSRDQCVLYYSWSSALDGLTEPEDRTGRDGEEIACDVVTQVERGVL
jgi:hypothetical protein